MRVFRQITHKDRVKISRWKAVGLSNAEIARKSGFHRSTITREFQRNSGIDDFDRDFFEDLNSWYSEESEGIRDPKPSPRNYWTADSATRIKEIRDSRANKIRPRKNRCLMDWVVKKLRANWSPEQIAGRSKLEGPGPISYQCIYNFISADRKKGGRLFTKLKRFGKRKQRCSGRSYTSKIKDRVFIDKRPPIVSKRTRLGDLEADLVAGYRHRGYILTIIDRTSRLVVLEKLKTKRSEEVFLALKKAIEEFKIFKTLTVDNGKEFQLHKKLALEKKIKIYFTRPYTSQDKGSVENMNGLIRQSLRSRKHLSRISDLKLKQIQNHLNSRPRKILNYLTPKEAHNKNLPKEMRF